MAEAPSSKLDGIFSIRANRHLRRRRVENLDVLSSLLAISARPNADDMKELVLFHERDEEFKACCLGAVTSAVNPFIPGMHMLLVLAAALNQATEGERRPIRDLATSVKTLLLEIFERLPQTVASFQRAGGDCSTVLDPDQKAPTGKAPFEGPLTMMLSTRKQRETFCSVPLVMDFLSRTFALGLPNVMDTEGVLRNVNALNQLSGSRRGGACVRLVLGEQLVGNLNDTQKRDNLEQGRGLLKAEKIEKIEVQKTKQKQPSRKRKVPPNPMADPASGAANELNLDPNLDAASSQGDKTAKPPNQTNQNQPPPEGETKDDPAQPSPMEEPARNPDAASSQQGETTRTDPIKRTASQQRRRGQRVLFGKDRLADSLISPRALLQGANYRVHSLSFAPGAQFVLAGLFAKPTEYYRVPAMRMALDFVLYLGVLTALGFFLFFQTFTTGVESDDCDDGDCILDREFAWSREGACAAIFVCVSRLPWDSSAGYIELPFARVLRSLLKHSTDLRDLQASYGVDWSPSKHFGGYIHGFASMYHVDGTSC